MAYTRGNLAVKERARQEQVQQQRYRETTKVVTRRRELPIREKLLYLLTLVACIVIAGMLISRYAHIYQINYSINTASKDISKLQTNIAQLKIQKERLENQIVPTAKQQGYIEPTREPIRVEKQAAK
ncbi:MULTISPECIES: hypothetical protein [Paenibacillus]|jgi:cell division protein FtsL|uniref:Cell division protein FtsL n=2 Tax=Paenibacillus TaxID=44249 RepID=A0A0K2FBQ3_9BACL|nr:MULTISPECIES: hypothetical protein [Paenibacillus]KAF6636400.1 hypothetical protein H6F38_03920 [Paenibacillus sp. EKM208P]ALA43065.1 hypothetical protein ABE82_16750 [Paenibacillus peoriae]AOK89037.1 hypothetical protein AOU00_03965 [Paenibacillus polymyxa]APB70479.1 hypothetical protein PPYC1_08990 [Paenibacillus polymyxa]APB75145.1 hypothetical protein PPYC2_09240 [Paenibacillus polymyxa]